MVWATLYGNDINFNLPIILGQVAAMDVMSHDSKAVIGSFSQDRGNLEIQINDPLFIVVFGIFGAITCALIVWCMVLFRRIIRDIAMSNPFDSASVTRLRCIGWTLIGFNFVNISSSWLLAETVGKGLVLADGRTLQSVILLLSWPWQPFSRILKDGSVQIVVEADFSMAFCGVILLALAEAFRVGRNLREESEGFL